MPAIANFEENASFFTTSISQSSIFCWRFISVRQFYLLTCSRV